MTAECSHYEGLYVNLNTDGTQTKKGCVHSNDCIILQRLYSVMFTVTVNM